MAGTIFGLGLSQQLDSDGAPMAGGQLAIYEASTTTPVDIYRDYTLSNLHPWPLELDSAGRIPAFWLADGSYRVRLTDADGNEIFDEAIIVAVGPSSGSGGGGDTIDATTIAETGDWKWRPVAGTVTGWVRANGRTIGSVTSGGTERANADTEDLFLYLWTNFSNSLCAVSGGRGGSAAADWSANKTIATLDMRGRAPFGLDDMGNSAAGVLAAGTPTSAASTVGAETVTLAKVNLPSTTLSIASLTGSVNTAITNGTNVVRLNGGFASVDTAGSGAEAFDSTPDDDTLSLTSGTVTFGGSIPLGGSGTAVNKMPPGRLGSWYIKL
jgi:microcystin-dependent protein